MVEAKKFNPLLNPKEVSQSALIELQSLREILEARNGKKITGNEYPRHPNGLYRSDLFGVLVATIYTQQGFFYSPVGWKYGRDVSETETFAATNIVTPLSTANSKNPAQFLQTLEERGYDIPPSGGVLLEIDPDKVIYRDPGVGYGVLVDKLNVTSLTNACKQYVLDELQLGKNSYAYHALMDR